MSPSNYPDEVGPSDDGAPLFAERRDAGTAPACGRAMSTPDTATVLFSLVVVVLICQVAGALARRVGQPAVIGEIVAGTVLAPPFWAAGSPTRSSLLTCARYRPQRTPR